VTKETRRRIHRALKAKIALEVTGTGFGHGSRQRYEVHPNQIYAWMAGSRSGWGAPSRPASGETPKRRMSGRSSGCTPRSAKDNDAALMRRIDELFTTCQDLRMQWWGEVAQADDNE
jgi:hypothetical protein